MIAIRRCRLCRRSFRAQVDPEGKSMTDRLCVECQAVIDTDRANAR